MLTASSVQLGHVHRSRAAPFRSAIVLRAASTAVLSRTVSSRTLSKSKKDLAAWEQQVLDALATAKGRGKDGLSTEQVAALEQAVAALEAAGGVAAPTTLPELDGKWRLLYTSRPGTASPIQRSFTGVDAFSVFQEVAVAGDDPRVNNIVEFGGAGYLKVEAQASIDSRPLPGFMPREGKGLPFGILGVSITDPPVRKDMRVDFQFDKAAFYFSFLPFSVPYPVPFRILGDERKGWIDVTYMNEDATFRLTRGNKGTLFILVKDVPLKDQLRAAITRGDDAAVEALLDELVEANPTRAPARSPLAAGTWRLVWSKQAANAGALQKFGSKQAKSYQIIDGETGELTNLVDLTSLVRIKAAAQCAPESDTRTSVFIAQAGFELGGGDKPWFLPLPGPRNNGVPGYVDWLYLDKDIRVTRGNKGSVFVHYRE